MEISIELSSNSFGVEHTGHIQVMSSNRNVCVYHVPMDFYQAVFYGDFWTFATNNTKLPMNFSKFLGISIADYWKITLN